jgi:hypothetical protein
MQTVTGRGKRGKNYKNKIKKNRGSTGMATKMKTNENLKGIHQKG